MDTLWLELEAVAAVFAVDSMKSEILHRGIKTNQVTRQAAVTRWHLALDGTSKTLIRPGRALNQAV